MEWLESGNSCSNSLIGELVGIITCKSPRRTASPIQRLRVSGPHNSIFNRELSNSLAAGSNSLSLSIQCGPLGASTSQRSASATLSGNRVEGTCQTWTEALDSSSRSGILSAMPRQRKPMVSVIPDASINLTPLRFNRSPTVSSMTSGSRLHLEEHPC
uniref:Uncharacterized protein n=1 Tax=uncultured marine group II/III euryarchaeote KM3_72_A06 TaxID=1456496 RepID=A0A075HJ47_9EURY|nr:hypothetical protein [uncultured marine group II/III euryarchaeote KM3_72_A06]